MDYLSLWIVPPLVGAVIGYITNWLAIKMLFRPLTEKRLFGVRLPFTPGLLPRERARIASSLGETVSKDLLTREVLAARLADPELRSSASATVGRLLDSVLDMDAGEAFKGITSSGDTVKDAVGAAFSRLARNPAFLEALERAVQDAVAELGSQKLGDILPEEAFRSIIGKAEGLPDKERIAAFFLSASRSRAFADLLSLLVSRVSSSLFDALYPMALAELDIILADRGLRANVQEAAVKAIRSAIDRMGFFQRLFISAAQLDKTIVDTMPETVSDLMAAAKGVAAKDSTSSVIKEAFVRTAKASLSTPAVGARDGDGPEGGGLLKAILSSFGAEEAKALREGLIEAYRDRADASLGDILEGLGIGTGAIGAFLARLASRGVSSEPGMTLTSVASAFAKGLSENLSGKNLGALAGVEGEARDAVADYLAGKILEFIGRELPAIMESVDIRRVVVEKVESLDMIDIEKMLLRVIDKELLWITILGGVLGGVIGIFQSLFMFLGMGRP